MKVTSFLALKFLSGKGRGLLFSSLTFMAVFGVMLSVAAFLVVQAVMSGFNQDIRQKVLGFSAHVVWTLKPAAPFDPAPWEALQKDPQVAGVMHYLEGEAIIRTEDGDTQGVRVRGVDPQWGVPSSSLEIFFNEGEDWSSLQGSERDEPKILLGRELIAALGLVPFLSDGVELIYPFGEVGPTGEMEPNIRSFRVGGRFRSGYYEYDNKFALIDLKEARRVLGENATEQVGIFLKDPFQTEAFLEKYPGMPGGEKVRTWQEIHRSLFQVLKLERVGMGLVLTLMILLSSFNIFSLLMMLVFQRRREIGVLKALGLSASGVGKVLYRAGLWIGVGGGLIGGVLGLTVIEILSRAKIRLPAPYYIERLPIQWSADILLLTVILALGMSLLAASFPAWQGRKLTVIEAIRRD